MGAPGHVRPLLFKGDGTPKGLAKAGARSREMLAMQQAGATTAEIAAHYGIARKTVTTHLRHAHDAIYDERQAARLAR